jgi:hypothetical protein
MAPAALTLASPPPQRGEPSGLWATAPGSRHASPLLDAFDVLIKRASWRDSIMAAGMLPVFVGLRHLWLLVLRLARWVTRRSARRK